MGNLTLIQRRFVHSRSWLLLGGWLFALSAGFSQTQEVPVYPSFDALQLVFSSGADTTYVINFWATWCKPCVKELPYFEEAYESYQGQPVRIILVSLDFPNQIESRLLPFIREKGLRSDVVVLTDPDANAWIPRIAEEWSGAIPATLVVNGTNRVFREGDFESLADLREFIRSCNN
ncbi:MAG: TlpA disulfide reductase family protein [Saprospiraceae bacterium]